MFLRPVVYLPWLKFFKPFSHNCYCHQMKIRYSYFQNTVQQWVTRISTDSQNVNYLPGYQLTARLSMDH